MKLSKRQRLLKKAGRNQTPARLDLRRQHKSQGKDRGFKR